MYARADLIEAMNVLRERDCEMAKWDISTHHKYLRVFSNEMNQSTGAYIHVHTHRHTASEQGRERERYGEQFVRFNGTMNNSCGKSILFTMTTWFRFVLQLIRFCSLVFGFFPFFSLFAWNRVLVFWILHFFFHSGFLLSRSSIVCLCLTLFHLLFEHM